MDVYMIQGRSMHRLAAEAIGTFALVLAGTGAVIIDSKTGGGVTHVGVALTFGLIIMVMIYALGHISGAHFNPAVTLAFAVGRHLPLKEVQAFWSGQFLGASAASGMLALILPSGILFGAVHPAVPIVSALIWELILSFFLMLVI